MNRAKWAAIVVGTVLAVVHPCAWSQSNARQEADLWTSMDKANHFAFSALMSSAAGKYHGRAVGAALALVPGVLKEMSDLNGSGTPSVKDMVANFAGAVTGALLPENFLVVPITYQSGFLITYSRSL